MSEKLHSLGIYNYFDLLQHGPYRVASWQEYKSGDILQIGGDYILGIIPTNKPPIEYRRKIWRVTADIENSNMSIDLVYFNQASKYAAPKIEIGQKVTIRGKIEEYNNFYQIVHPEIVSAGNKFEAVYPLTYGIGNKYISSLISKILPEVKAMNEWLDLPFMQQHKLPSWDVALKTIHVPKSIDDVAPEHPARMRLACDEMLASQLSIALSRKHITKQKGISMAGDGSLIKQAIDKIGFKLTNDQITALKDIKSDMESSNRMMRLLQGDVGSGKTVVALLAMLQAVESGYQAVLMAPTEVLAEQHYRWISDILDVNVQMISGSDRAKERREKLAQIANDESKIIIGTHALFYEAIEFAKLGLVIIDEQHRFGVRQRLALAEKGKNTDMLLMSATPIPRTLTLTLYGDLELSVIKEKPAGRQAIQTNALSIAREDDIIANLKIAIANGEKAYWICPLVEENEEQPDDDRMSAIKRHEILQNSIDGIGVVHGQMKSQEKDEVFQAFKNGEIKVLVATTVVEVGVDVPDATIMIIENAQMFGLSQLHQLRGRVGRGNKKSSCLLLHNPKLSTNAKKRLDILRQSNDGFYIAEEDLNLRGGGEILGTKQSGLPRFKFARFPEHLDLLMAIRSDVKLIMEKDPNLNSDRGQALRNLLTLYRYRDQLRFLSA